MCMITGELSHPGTESSGARARNRGDGRRFNEENLVPGSDRRYGDVVIEAVKLWLEDHQVYYLLTILMPFRLLKGTLSKCYSENASRPCLLADSGEENKNGA